MCGITLLMNKIILLASIFGLTACGLESTQNELIGQVKKVKNQTPLLCDARMDVDVSLGVMRNGIGSMSVQDIWLTALNETDKITLKKAGESGEMVKITYDVKRLAICYDHVITHVEITK
jgi:hypothetical protein